MKPISKHKSVHYAKTPRQLELERKYRYNRLVSRLVKDMRMFEQSGADSLEVINLLTQAQQDAMKQYREIYGNR